MDISKFAIPEIIFGRGSLQYVGLCARRLGAEKAFLVSDSGLERAGWVPVGQGPGASRLRPTGPSRASG